MPVFRRRANVIVARRCTQVETIVVSPTITLGAVPGQWVVDDGTNIQVTDDADFTALYVRVV